MVANPLPIDNINNEALCQDSESSLPRTLSCLNSYESADLSLQTFKRRKLANKIYVKIINGLLLGKQRGWEVWWGALTESEYAIGIQQTVGGLEWGGAMHKLSSKMRTDYGRDAMYCWIDHTELVKGFNDFYRHNRHFIYVGENPLDAINLDDYWRDTKHYGSFFSKLEPIKNPAGTASYLVSKYVVHEGFQRACFSQNWVFPHWFEFSKWHQRQCGNYPSLELLSRLSAMSEVKRYLEPEYFQWFLSKQTSLKDKLANKIIGYTDYESEMLRNWNRRHHTKIAFK